MQKMNKKEIVDKIATEKEDKILVSHLLDLDLKASARGFTASSGFLDLNRKSMIDEARKYFNCTLCFFGGYEDAERKAVYFLPDENSLPDYSDLAVLTSKTLSPVSHRDVLGSLMSLGIDRSLVGDILISPSQVQIMIKKEISQFIVQNFLRAGKVHLSFEISDISNIQESEKRTKEISGTIKSLRLDSVLSLAFSISRTASKDFILASKVFVNDKCITKSDFALKEGDKLTLRGKGKAFLKEIGSLSRKERIFITIEKYI
ncbi:MAG: hypothetical protein IJE46_06245 [Clostridia bacterium]|nr:hypothetical protein [Clostridia bacterium]